MVISNQRINQIMKMSATNPKLNLSLNKRKHRMVGDKGYWLYIYSVSDDRDTSYPTQVQLWDSKEGVQRSLMKRKGMELVKEGCL